MKASKKQQKTTFSRSFISAVIIFALGLALTYLTFNQSFDTGQINGKVLGRSYPVSTADLHAGDGGTVVVDGVSAIFSSGTFDNDIYMRVDETARGNPISVNGLWQVSNMWNIRMRYMSNDNEASSYDAKKQYSLSFPYTKEYLKTDQGVRFDENYLKLVRGETSTGPWEVLHNTVVDTANQRVSVITNRGGYYMITGGSYNAPNPTSTSSSTDSSPRTVILKDNEIVITITPQVTDELKQVETTEDDIQIDEEPEVTEAPAAIGGTEIVDDNFFTAILRLMKSLFE